MTSAEVLFLETNRAGNGTTAMRIAQEMGHRAHFITSDPNQYQWMATNPLTVADEVSLVRSDYIDELLHFASGRSFRTAVAFDDDRVISAAILRDFIGVKSGPRYSSLVAVRFKDHMRRRLSSVGYSVPFRIVSLGDPDAVSGQERYPCVAKPADGSGSLGVRICHTATDLEHGLAYLRSRRNITGSSEATAEVAVIEDLVQGDQYSAEMTWDAAAGTWRVIGLTKAFTRAGPIPLTLGCIYPYPAEGLGEDLDEQLDGVLRGFGLDNTVVHLEFRVEAGTPRVLEINPRPAGSRILQLVREVHGRDVLSEAYLRLHLGEQAEISPASAVRGRVAGVWFAAPDAPGWVSEPVLPRVPDPRIVDSGVLGTFPLHVPDVMNADHRVAYAIAVARSVGEVEESLREFISQVQIVPGRV